MLLTQQEENNINLSAWRTPEKKTKDPAPCVLTWCCEVPRARCLAASSLEARCCGVKHPWSFLRSRCAGGRHCHPKNTRKILYTSILELMRVWLEWFIESLKVLFCKENKTVYQLLLHLRPFFFIELMKLDCTGNTSQLLYRHITDLQKYKN